MITSHLIFHGTMNILKKWIVGSCMLCEVLENASIEGLEDRKVISLILTTGTTFLKEG